MCNSNSDHTEFNEFNEGSIMAKQRGLKGVKINGDFSLSFFVLLLPMTCFPLNPPIALVECVTDRTIGERSLHPPPSTIKGSQTFIQMAYIE